MAKHHFLHLFRIEAGSKQNNYKYKKAEGSFWIRHKKELISAKIGVLNKLIVAKKRD
jgi:hypothetical protein